MKRTNKLYGLMLAMLSVLLMLAYPMNASNPKNLKSHAKTDRQDGRQLYVDAIRAYMDGKTSEFSTFIRRASDAKYPPAQYAYAVEVLDKDVNNDAKIVDLIRRSADAGYGEACSYLSSCYSYRWHGLEWNTDSATVWSERGAELGSFDANVLAGFDAYNAGDTLRAMECWERAYNYELRRDSLYREYTTKLSLDFCIFYFEQKHLRMKSLDTMYDRLLTWKVEHATTREEFEDAYELAKYVSDNYYTAKSKWYLAYFNFGYGDVIPVDKDNAVMYLEEAAGDLPDAMKLLADCYNDGCVKERDPVYASVLYKIAADNGCVDAMYKLAFIYHEQNLYDKALEWAERPELADSADIQYLLGSIYYDRQEYKKAISCFELAAEGGNAEGMWKAYLMYSDIFYDEEKAFEYNVKAASAGHAKAVNDLALCYLNGKYVEKDVQKAIEMFEKAKDSGSAGAYNNLAIVYSSGEKVYGVKPDYKRAVEYWRKGAEMNDASSLYHYAICLLKGKYGVSKDKAKGYALMYKAAENGSPSALMFLYKKEIKKGIYIPLSL